jgi:hypothetical protein
MLVAIGGDGAAGSFHFRAVGDFFVFRKGGQRQEEQANFLGWQLAGDS